MANEQLESFLKEEAAAATAPAAPEPAPREPSEAPRTASTPEPRARAAPEPKAPEDDAEPPQPLDGEPVIPRRAYEDERRKRQDWKEKAARFEGEVAAMRRQLEEMQRASQPQPPAVAPQPQQPLPPIDIVGNPQGFVERVQQVFAHERTQLEQKMLNDRLNHSEERLRDKIGDQVDQYVADFQQFAQADPSLWGKLYAQANPYGWLQKEIDRQRLHRDVGNDPEAFKAKLRAEWEAEQQQRPAPVSPAAGMQPSLATARSVAGRTSSTWSGEPSLEDVLLPVQNRKSQNGQTKRF